MYNKISGLTKRNITKGYGSLSFLLSLHILSLFLSLCSHTHFPFFTLPHSPSVIFSLSFLSLYPQKGHVRTQQDGAKNPDLRNKSTLLGPGFPFLRTTKKSFCVLSYTNCEILSWKPKMTDTREHDLSFK